MAGYFCSHFGRRLIPLLSGSGISESDLDVVYDRCYRGYVEGLDAIDNGISAYPTDAKPSYKNSELSVAAAVGRFNGAGEEHELQMQRFTEAMQFVGGDFTRYLHQLVCCWLPGRAVVHEAFKRYRSSEDRRILVLSDASMWKDHLFMVEAELGCCGEILYVVYPDKRSGSWMIKTVPDSEEAEFTNRKALPEPWRGLRDAQLDALTGVPGGVFTHASGFIGAHKTFDGALALARMAATH